MIARRTAALRENNIAFPEGPISFAIVYSLVKMWIAFGLCTLVELCHRHRSAPALARSVERFIGLKCLL